MVVGALLVSCSLTRSLTRSNAEQEPAPLRDPVWSVRLSGQNDAIVARANDDAVVVVIDGELVVLDRRDGKRRWSQAVEISSYDPDHQVFIADDSVVVSDGRSVAVYDLADGEQRFQHSGDQYRADPVAVVEAGVLITSCTDHGRICTVSLLDFRSGKPTWQRQFEQLRELLTPAPRDVTPGLGGPGAVDLVDPLQVPGGDEAIAVTYAPSSETPDRATRVDVRTGALLGSFALPAEYGGAAVDTGDTRLLGTVMLHGAAACGQHTARDARTGAVLWSRPVYQRHVELEPIVLSRGDVPVGCGSKAPLVAGGLLVSAPRHQPQIMSLSTGNPQWTAKPEGVWLGYDGGIAMVWSDPVGPYLALDTRTDKQLWTHQPPWLLKRDPAKAKRMLAAYAVGFGQFFYSGVEENGRADERSVVRVLDLRSGRPVWAARGGNRLLGVGADWVVTASVGEYRDPVEIRLFKR